MLKKAVLLSGIGIITLMVVLPFAIFDRNPVVVKTEDVNTITTKQAKQLLKKVVRILTSDQVDRAIVLSYDQVKSLMALLSHTLPMISARSNKKNDNWIFFVTFKVPKIQSLYVNASMHLEKGDIDLSSTMVNVGRFSISANTLLKLAVGFINFSKVKGDHIDHTRLFERVAVDQERIVTYMHPEFDLEPFKVSMKSSGKRVLKQITLGQDVSIQTNHYLNLLEKLAASTAGIEGIQISLSDYVSPLFAEARRRSVNNAPSNENQYAMLALAYFTGDALLRRVIKNIYAPNISAISSRSKTGLQKRSDLLLHFVYSATIEMITSAETGIGIGEIKELSDANKGGSGFSFADLMADKAGVYFAKSISDPLTAQKMQSNLLSIKQEEDFFPSIVDLPEGLDEAEFAEQFGNIESEAYRMLEREIDQRIKSRKIYR